MFGQKWLSLNKVLVFKQKLLYSGKSGCLSMCGCIQEKVVVFGQVGCIRAKWLYSGKSAQFLAKVVVLGMYGCMQKRWLYMGKSCCIRLKVIVVG